MLAVIGGSGLYQLVDFQRTKRQVVKTPYGETSSPLSFGRLDGGQEFVFLTRHGVGHTIAAHRVNYRANLWALHQLGVTEILSISSVGGIAQVCMPGAMVVPDQLIDYTFGRAHSFFEEPNAEVVHIDFTQPYSPDIREKIVAAAQAQGISVINEGVYGCTQGPRLETAAEIRRLERDGCTIVGMTAMPEAILARELDLAYASLCLVTNYAAGKGSSQQQICFDQAHTHLEQTICDVQKIIKTFTA